MVKKKTALKKTTTKKKRTGTKKSTSNARKKKNPRDEKRAKRKSSVEEKNGKITKKQIIKKECDDAAIRPLTPDFLNVPVATIVDSVGKVGVKPSESSSISAGGGRKRKLKATRKRTKGNSNKRKKEKRGNCEKALILMDEEEYGPSSPWDFEKYKIIPDIIDKCKLRVLDCHFLSEERKVVFENMQYVKAEETIVPPTVTWKPKPGTSYTLVMLNVDSPKPATPTFRSWIHWGVCNITAPSTIDEGHVFCEYIACCPAKGCGVHRFCIVLLEQKWPTISTTESVIVVAGSQACGRPRWNLRKFSAKYEIKPVAAKVFRSQWDSSCPSTYEKMGF